MTPSESLARDAGQVLLGGFPGTAVDSAFADLIRAGHVGGAILFRRNIEDPAQTRRLLALLAALPTPEPLMFSVDQEGGRVQRMRAPFPELPQMRRFGQAGRKTLARRAGGLLARTLRSLGFHQNYAPVLDVDSNPANPVIGDRAFSSDPNVVARLGAAFIDGMQSEGVAACGKHFPGHGDTHVDSHLALPRLEHDRQRLMDLELVPFRAAARVDVAAIMTAHILFPALDPDHPATLSENILGPLLRDELRYDGVIVSDDLEMKAVADHYGIEDAAVRAIRAGCDQLLICHQPMLVAQAHAAIVKAVEQGGLSRARLAEAAGRVRRLKQTYRVSEPTADDLAAALDDPDYATLLADLDAPPAPIGLDPTEAIAELELDPGDEDEVLELDV